MKIPLNAEIAGIQPVSDDMEFLVILQYLALIIDPFFQAMAKQIAEEHNDGDWESCWRAPPTKTWIRMLSKMKRIQTIMVKNVLQRLQPTLICHVVL